MASLLTYLACERVSIEQETNAVSIMGVLETINVAVPQGAPPTPPKVFLPMRWAVYSLWQKEPRDTGEFSSQSILFAANGEKLLETPVANWGFKEAQFRHQVIDRIEGFPIWTPGRLQLTLMLKGPGDQAFREYKSLQLLLLHQDTPRTTH